MGLRKREYIDQETVITAENMNNIQDAVIALEDGLFSVDDDKSGEVITITDAAKRGFRSLNIYGKTTQDGTPTPDAPVDLVSVGNSGSITVSVTGGNDAQKLNIATPNGLPGIPVTSGGNYTDANGQQWECDEIDYSRGVYIQRYCQVALNGNEQWNKNDGWMAEWTNYFTVKLANNNLGSGVQALKSLCSHFKRSIADVNGHMSTNYGRFCFNTNISSITEWKEWLAEQNEAGKPITLVYPLDTPIETPLSEEELTAYASLHTYKDNTTVSNDAGAWMDVEYVMDAKKYIDSLVSGGIAPARVE